MEIPYNATEDILEYFANVSIDVVYKILLAAYYFYLIMLWNNLYTLTYNVIDVFK